MIMTPPQKVQTFSVKEAADALGLSRAIVSRLCSRGIVGTRHESVEFSQHFYRLTEADLKVLESRKLEWENKLQKKRA
jgi:predicted transcriptional regulator